MTRLSRVDKYKELRDSLANDTAPGLETRDLDEYKARLAAAAPDNFEAPESTPASSQNPVHARREAVEEPREVLRRSEKPAAEPAKEEPVPEEGTMGNTFDDDYLNQYIREVKAYNRSAGTAVSDDTRVNVLSGLSRETVQKAPEKPYSEQVSQPKKKTAQKYNYDSAEVPVFGRTGAYTSPVSTYSRDPQDTDNMSTQDLAAEVQNLARSASSEPVYDERTMGTDTFNKQLDLERSARQQLLNQTTQMQHQLDSYEDNLSEVNDKMNHTNKILNIVLIVLICALLVALGVVIYWLWLSGGSN